VVITVGYGSLSQWLCFLILNSCVRSVRPHGIFEKAGSKRSHSELMAVSVMKLNLNFKFISQCVFSLF